MKQAVVLLFLVSSVYVTGVYSALGFAFDIPNLSASLASAIGNGFAPLVAVNESVNENLALDSTGALYLVQKIIGNATMPLDSVLKQLQDTSISTPTDVYAFVGSMQQLAQATYLAAGYDGILYGMFVPPGVTVFSAKTYAVQLSAKLSPSVYGAIMTAITALVDSLIKESFSIDSFYSASSYLQSALNTAYQQMATSSTISSYVTPFVVDKLSTSIAKVKSAIDGLANALQQAVLELVPPTVDPMIGARLPNIVPLLVRFNASADSTRTSVKQTAKSLANDATSAYSSVTSSPWNWNDGNIANLTTFLANFTALVQNNFTQPLDAGIDYVKANVNASLTNKVNQLAQALSKVYTNISDTSTKSTSIFKGSCVTSYKATLLKIPATLSRLNNCIQLEGDSFNVINSHATEAIRRTKEDATKSMKQLQLCYERNIACTKKIFDSFESQYKRAVTTLTIITDYTTSSLWSIAGRISDCTSAISTEIQAQVQTLRANFNGCLSYGFYHDAMQ